MAKSSRLRKKKFVIHQEDDIFRKGALALATLLTVLAVIAGVCANAAPVLTPSPSPAQTTGQHATDNQSVGVNTDDPAIQVELCAKVEYVLQGNFLDDRLIECLEGGRRVCERKATDQVYYQGCLDYVSEYCRANIAETAAKLLEVRAICQKQAAARK